MSLCDKCYSPGACCKRMFLSSAETSEVTTFWNDGGRDGVVQQLRDRGYPFEPIELYGEWTDEETGRPYAAWWYSCPKLGVDGRCTDYENRPGLCRTYQPASDGLCVHFGGAEGVDLVGID